uniref:Uncharacterized protein n=1 Tax=Tetradesmus obliquus TaxID=3088 RepID=A0A383V387_TETOB|eukprot:jgi/Sobl393_1/270/SZX60058.1
MQSPGKALLLALLLSLCCTLCGATSRSLQQDAPPAAASDVEPAAATPQEPACEWHPPAPPGISFEKWTARWPKPCMGTPVDKWCDAKCLDGYTAYPHAPRIYCHSTPDGRADWAFPIEGDCVAFCPGLPPQADGVSWPASCNNGLIEGTPQQAWAPGPPSTCTATCGDG